MDRAQTVHVGEFDVDVIATLPVGSSELDGLDDGNRLFFLGHRWAFDTAKPLQLGTRRRTDLVEVPVATPAGLVAAKSHAVGYPRAIRRATKHGGDLYDVFRLLEVFDADGSIADEIADAPHGLGPLIAAVLRQEILTNPARAAAPDVDHQPGQPRRRAGHRRRRALRRGDLELRAVPPVCDDRLRPTLFPHCVDRLGQTGKHGRR